MKKRLDTVYRKLPHFVVDEAKMVVYNAEFKKKVFKVGFFATLLLTIISYSITAYLSTQNTDAATILTVSGTLRQYDQSTFVTSGTVRVAVNGSDTGQTGSVSFFGSWSVSNVSVNSGDVVTIFLDGTTNGTLDSSDAVGVTKWDGSGNVTGVELYERHLSIGSDDNPTVSNADLSSYDNSVSSDPDIFFDVDANNDLTVDNNGGLSDEKLYIRLGSIYRPDSSSSGNVTTHDIDIRGMVDTDGNTFYIGGDFYSRGAFEKDTSTLNFNASSGTQNLDYGTDPFFYNITHSAGSTLNLVQGWSSRQQIDISSSMVSGGASLTDFPVLIKITDANNDVFGTAQPDGDDIVFTDSNNRRLAHEIEDYNDTGGSENLLIWVKIPTLSYSATTTIYMHYGNGGVSTQENVQKVWDDNFMGVWHLGEASGTFYDSTKYNNDSTSVVSTNYGQTGKVGKGVSFNSGGYISIPDNINNSLDITGDITISSWINVTGGAGSLRMIVDKGDNTVDNYRFRINSDNKQRFSWINSGWKTYAPSGSPFVFGTSDGLKNVAVIHNSSGNSLSWYLDGSQDGTSTSTTTSKLSNSTPLYIGNSGGINYYFQGVIDEVRISNVQRSAGWLATEYNNASSPGSYETFNTAAVDNITIDNDFLNSAGTTDFNNKNVYVGNNFTVSGGTVTGGSSTITVGGNWDSSTGTFTYGTSIVSLTGTGSLKTPGTQYTSYFYDLNAAASTKTTTMLSHVAIDGTLSLGGGTLTDGASSYTFACMPTSSGDTAATTTSPSTVTINRFIFMSRGFAAGSNMVISGNFGTQQIELYPEENNITYNLNSVTTSGLITVMQEPTKTGMIFNANTALSVGGLAIGNSWANSTTTTNFVSTASVDIGSSGIYVVTNGGSHNLNLNSSTVTNAGPWTLSAGTGSISQNSSSSSVTFDGSAAQAVTGTITWNNLAIANTAGSPSDSVDVDPSAAQTVNGTLSVSDGQWTPYTGDIYNVVTIGAQGIMKPDASASITAKNTWTNSGTFTHNSGTVVFSQAPNGFNITTGGSHFYNVTFNKTATGATQNRTYLFDDFTAEGNVEASNNTSEWNAINKDSGSSVTMYIQGSLSFPSTAGAGAFLFGDATNPLNFGVDLKGNYSASDSNLYDRTSITFSDTTKNQTITHSAGDITTGTWTVDKGSYVASLSTALNLSSGAGLTLTSGIFATAGNNLTVNGTFSNNATLRVYGAETLSFTKDTDSGTVEYVGSGTTTYTSLNYGNSFYNLKFNSTSGSNIFRSNGTVSVGGNLDVTSGIFDISTNDNALSVTGNLTVGGGTFDGDAATANVDVGGNVTISSGTLAAPLGNLTVNGNFTNNGNFNHSSGTVIFNGTSTIAGSATPPAFAVTFNNLTVNAGKIIKFTSGEYFKVIGTFSLAGSSGSHVTLDSSDGVSQWYINYQPGSTSVSYADVSNSGCDDTNSPSTSNLNLDATNSNVTNNGYCWFSPYLSFSMDSNTVTFDNLNNANNWTHTKTSTFTTSTNAKNGYVIQGYLDNFLTSLAYPSETIDDFTGTWAVPALWDNTCVSGGASYCGFGYTSNDTLVQGSNRFANGTKYAAYSQTPSGDVLADHTDAIDTEVTNEQFIITHKVSVPTTQSASTYQANLIVIVTATY